MLHNQAMRLRNLFEAFAVIGIATAGILDRMNVGNVCKKANWQNAGSYQNVAADIFAMIQLFTLYDSLTPLQVNGAGKPAPFIM